MLVLLGPTATWIKDAAAAAAAAVVFFLTGPAPAPASPDDVQLLVAQMFVQVII